MVERTVKLYECGVCGKPGRRYTIVTDEGSTALDRCDKHDTKLQTLLGEKDAIRLENQNKASFKVSNPTDIRQAQAKFRQQDSK